MVLDSEFAGAVRNGDVDWVADWLYNLDRPEDINEVDAEGTTVLMVKGPACRVCGHTRRGGCPGCFGNPFFDDKRTENVHYAISLSPSYSGKSFEELRLEDYQQGNHTPDSDAETALDDAPH